MSPHERGERAKKLLEDEVLTGAFADIRAGLVLRLESSPINDVETQHEIALMLQLLRRVKDQLQKYADELAVEQAQAKQARWLEKARERLSL